MIFTGTLKQRGKKTPKRLGSRPRLIMLHGVRFYLKRRKVLDRKFVDETGLNDSSIRSAVIKSLYQNYGISINCYGKEGSEEVPKDKPKQTPKDIAPSRPKLEPKLVQTTTGTSKSEPTGE